MHTDIYGNDHRYPPPVGYVAPKYERFSADEDWQRLCAQGLHFEPHAGPTRLCSVRGDCMEPFLIAGKHMLEVRPFLAGEQIEDGAMYTILWDEANDEIPYKSKMGIALTERILITKFLRFICGEWRCQCKDSASPLRGTIVSKVVGIVAVSAATACTPQEAVHARQPACGNPVAARSIECAGLGANAATSASSAIVAGPITIAHSHTPPPAITYTSVSSITAGPYATPSTVVVTVSGTYIASGAVGAPVMEDFYYGITTAGAGADDGSNEAKNNVFMQTSSSSTEGGFSQELTFSLAANTTQTYYFNALAGPGSYTLQFVNIFMKHEAIKR